MITPPGRCPLCGGTACGGRPGLAHDKVFDLMPLMNSQGAGMTSPENNTADQPVELKEYTYTRNGVEYTAQLSEDDAKRLDAKASGGTVDLAKPWVQKPAIEDTTPGYGGKADQKAADDAKAQQDAPANKARGASNK